MIKFVIVGLLIVSTIISGKVSHKEHDFFKMREENINKKCNMMKDRDIKCCTGKNDIILKNVIKK